MTGDFIRRRAGSRLGAALLIGAGLALADCADEGDRSAAAQGTGAAVATEAAAPAASAAAGAPEPTVAAASQSDATTATPVEVRNDPSAPLDTPLCGRAARERVAIATALEPDVTQGAGACAQTACFDPATDTFIGADGYRHVCQ